MDMDLSGLNSGFRFPPLMMALIAGIAQAACGSSEPDSKGPKTQKDIEVPPTLFELRLASEDPVDGWEKMKTRSDLYMQPTAFINANQLDKAEFVDGTEGSRWLFVALTPDAARVVNWTLLGWDGYFVVLTSGIEISCARRLATKPMTSLYFQPAKGAQVEASLQKLIQAVEAK